LGETLKGYFGGKTDMTHETSLLSTELLVLLNEENFHFLVKNGLIQLYFDVFIKKLSKIS